MASIRQLGETLLSRLATGPGVYAACAALPITFLVMAVMRLHPFLDDVSLDTTTVDDWITYKRRALSILHDGLVMPIVSGHYDLPSGFLYNYFVAGVFRLFGENSSYVYLVQAALLGLSISAGYLAFRRYMTPGAGFAYLLTLPFFMYVDVFRHYTVTLLSENLLLFLLPLFFFSLLRCFERDSTLYALGAGLVLGLAFLSRPNVILVAPATVALLFFYAKNTRRGYLRLPIAFLVAFGLSSSVLLLRNYAVTGEVSLAAVTYPGYWRTPAMALPDRAGAHSVLPTIATYGLYYGRRVLFCLGLTFLGSPEYRLRPHWLLMWAGVFLFLASAMRGRRLEFWEAAALVFVVSYLGPTIAVAQLANYGFRMIVPVVPAALLLSVRGGQAWHAPRLLGDTLTRTGS